MQTKMTFFSSSAMSAHAHTNEHTHKNGPREEEEKKIRKQNKYFTTIALCVPIKKKIQIKPLLFWPSYSLTFE